jgi:predicted DNA binding protein
VGFGIIEPLAGGEESLKRYVSEMSKSDSIVKFNTTLKSAGAYWTRSVHQLDYPSIYETILESGSMTLLPVVIEGGIQYHDILSPTPRDFKQLLEKLRMRFAKVKIRHLSSKPGSLSRSLLTDKQMQAFKIAYKAGYYSVPRKVKVSQLAERIGIKRVAMQERLRRAEIRILTDYAKKDLI